MIQYEHHNELQSSGGMPVIIMAADYFHKHNLCNDEAALWREDDEVICAKAKDGTVIGVMTFIDNEPEAEFYIVVSYVIPAHRMEGIHAQMYAKLKEIARERGRKYIRSAVHVNNKGMHDHLLRQGRKKIAIMYQDEIENTVRGE